MQLARQLLDSERFPQDTSSDWIKDGAVRNRQVSYVVRVFEALRSLLRTSLLGDSCDVDWRERELSPEIFLALWERWEAICAAGWRVEVPQGGETSWKVKILKDGCEVPILDCWPYSKKEGTVRRHPEESLKLARCIAACDRSVLTRL
jgi:hypothetical protein